MVSSSTIWGRGPSSGWSHSLHGDHARCSPIQELHQPRAPDTAVEQNRSTSIRRVDLKASLGEIGRQNMNVGYGLLLDRACLGLEGGIRAGRRGHPPHQVKLAPEPGAVGAVGPWPSFGKPVPWSRASRHTVCSKGRTP